MDFEKLLLDPQIALERNKKVSGQESKNVSTKEEQLSRKQDRKKERNKNNNKKWPPSLEL